jgi:hypothetical protein
MIKKIISKLGLLLIITIVLNFIYVFTIYDRDLRMKSPIVFHIRDLNDSSADVIYISDCSNTNTVDEDSVKTTILENINQFYPRLRMRALDAAASHAGVFKYWVDEFDFKNKKPGCIILTVNLRSFNTSWINSNLENQLQESIVLMKPYPKLANRFLISLKAYDHKPNTEREQQIQSDWKTIPLLNAPYRTVKEWDSVMSNGSYLKPDGSWDFDKIGLACHYIKGFAFNINDKNPRLADIDRIVKWGNENGVKIYLNLIPENTQYAASLVSKDLLFLMRENADFIVKRYSTKNCVVLDHLELLPGEYFTEKNWTTEHYSYKGRMMIAKAVASEIKPQFEKDYVKKY